MPKTIICDIDGTICQYHNPSEILSPNHLVTLLPDVIEKFVEWNKKGYKILLITGRKESLREITTKQLAGVGIFYDQLIMGIGGGGRVLINDKKPNGDDTAKCYNLDRDCGLSSVIE